MERKRRLGSAQSNISAYSHPPAQEPPKKYQENLQFPENTQIDTGFVQPAKYKDFNRETEFEPNYDNTTDETFKKNQNFNEFQSKENYTQKPEKVTSSANTQ